MTVTVSSDDPRSVKALSVLATAPRWTKGHTKDGRPFFVVPGSDGRVYWTDTRACTCPDHRERGVACKHVLAVRMWTLQHKPAAPAPTGAGSATCTVCTATVEKAGAECRDCAEFLAYVDGAPGVQLAAGATDRYSVLFPAED